MSRAVRIYGFHDRVWHWIQAFAVLGLLATGGELRFPGLLPGLGYHAALTAHLGAGAFLALNAALGLFYFVTSGAIRHYVPQPRDYFTLAALQVRYYLGGMFRSAPHPFQKRPDARLNPLQQVTYLAILNLLLPLQVVTGLWLWNALAGHGGLGAAASLHALGAWLFATFLLLHVYLTTTGDSPLANLRAMVTGDEWLPDPVECDHPSAQGDDASPGLSPAPTNPAQEGTT